MNKCDVGGIFPSGTHYIRSTQTKKQHDCPTSHLPIDPFPLTSWLSKEVIPLTSDSKDFFFFLRYLKYNLILILNEKEWEWQ